VGLKAAISPCHTGKQRLLPPLQSLEPRGREALSAQVAALRALIDGIE
jgi:hypothetical protein